MRFVVADLWGQTTTPLATVSLLHVPIDPSPNQDRDKIGFTSDVERRLVDESLHVAPGSDVTPMARRSKENRADDVLRSARAS